MPVLKKSLELISINLVKYINKQKSIHINNILFVSVEILYDVQNDKFLQLNTNVFKMSIDLLLYRAL